MGREIGSTSYTRAQRPAYRLELRRNLDLFESYLDTAVFVVDGTIGMELSGISVRIRSSWPIFFRKAL